MEIFRPVNGCSIGAVVLSVAVSLLVGLYGSHARAQVVGDGHDFFAETQNPISSATGSFDSVTGVTGETAAGMADNFSLQLNTNLFDTSVCQNSPYNNPRKTCRG